MIIINIQESERQIISGIPEFVTVSTSVPSVVFYTLDGKNPSENSDVYIDKIYLTYNKPTVELRLFAIGASDVSDIFSISWNVKTPDLSKTALTGEEGINILPFGEEPEFSLAIDSDGNLAKQSVIDFVDLDLKANTTDRIGQKYKEGTSLPFINFPTIIRFDPKIITSTEDINFDPQAQVILINGYSGFNNQEIRVINRPNGTMSSNSKFYKDKSHYDNQPSGDFINYKYNSKTKKIILYYREYLDGRWIVSTQAVDAKSFDLTPMGGNRFVFKWINNRYMSKIF
jgi:hypothetical protein